MKDNAKWCETMKRTVRARTDSIHAFRGVFCTQHGIKKALRATKPLHVLIKVKTPCMTGGGRGRAWGGGGRADCRTP